MCEPKGFTIEVIRLSLRLHGVDVDRDRARELLEIATQRDITQAIERRVRHCLAITFETLRVEAILTAYHRAQDQALPDLDPDLHVKTCVDVVARNMLAEVTPAYRETA